jgi:acyl-CoA synthetase (AMP-forming)/AMP-acid ligase II
MPESLIQHLAGFIPDLFNSYGLTESSGTISVTAPGASIEQLAASVGVPVFEGAVRIVDAQGQPLAPGESGEVQLHGRHVFPGYLRNPDATRLAFTPDGWLRTGDTGMWREDGSLRLAGRLTEMYKSGGYNIYPREIEVVLESHPGVAMAAVIGVADPLWGEVGHAFVVPSGQGVSTEALVALCRERLAAYKLPKKIDLRCELPLLPIGKVDKKQLRNLLA